MDAQYTNPTSQVNKSKIPNNDIKAGSLIRFLRTWGEEELPDEKNFPTARIESVTRSASGFAIYETSAGSVWFDRVLAVILEPAEAIAA